MSPVNISKRLLRYTLFQIGVRVQLSFLIEIYRACISQILIPQKENIEPTPNIVALI